MAIFTDEVWVADGMPVDSHPLAAGKSAMNDMETWSKKETVNDGYLKGIPREKSSW